ncbi:hypothetical protein BRADI_5g26223v3 [Brachypodium distachyon]|uniref:Uncharacterized protein n=1 Tax=Brachypodium distachyon TaxID=15368 RepID=A0A2K2CJD5_BRADI|nr:hypothetical protein BRADI_5g26223v3 [Brachypodium distachyon]
MGSLLLAYTTSIQSPLIGLGTLVCNCAPGIWASFFAVACPPCLELIDCSAGVMTSDAYVALTGWRLSIS